MTIDRRASRHHEASSARSAAIRIGMALPVLALAAACGTGAPAGSDPGPGGSGSGGGYYGGGPATSSPSAATVTVADLGPGRALVDGSGRSLYLFEKDSGSSTCYGPCAAAWPPLLTARAPGAGPGPVPGDLGTTTRTDGSKQVTYQGHPLYRYAEDRKRGDTNGQGLSQFGAEWYLVSPEGEAVDGG